MKYMSLAMRTLAPANQLHENVSTDLLHASLGLTSEVVELRKGLVEYYRTGEVQKNTLEELGDLLWFCALGFHVIESVEPFEHIEAISQNAEPDFIRVMVDDLIEASGDLADALKRGVYGVKPDPGVVEGHLGSIALRTVLIGRVMGWSMQDIQTANIAKLQKRYPEKYSNESALNRDTAAEMGAF